MELVTGNAPPEFRRLVANPQTLLVSSLGLGIYPEVEKYAEIKAMLGGETAFQGAPADPATDNILIRNVDNVNFGRDRIESRVNPIAELTGSELDSLLTRMRNGQVDAWLAHLAEGVRDNQRRPGDPTSSRAEFAALISKGLLTDNTVLVHGNGLEADDFTAMRRRLEHSVGRHGRRTRSQTRLVASVEPAAVRANHSRLSRTRPRA